MLKKMLAVALAASMCLSLATCAESGSSSDVSSNTTSSSTPDDTSNEPVSSEPESSEPDSSTPDSSDESLTPPEAETSITPAMWKVEGANGGVVYFLGSMHALKEECYPLPDEIMNAYNSSDSLAVECDIYEYTNDLDAQMELLYSLVYSDGTTIADHIDSDLYESTKQILTDAGIYTSLYDYYNVILWSSLVEIAMVTDAGLDSNAGIDMNLLTLAHDEGKDIIEIESVELQNNLLYGQPDELNVFMLETSVYYYEDQCEALKELYEAWCTGDVEAIWAEDEIDEELEDEFEISDELQAMIDSYNKQMLDDRNAGMSAKAIEMLENGDNVFYVVGAAHFGGETGILQALEDAGYTVERVEYN